MPRTLYRIVKGPEPTIDDFRSYECEGRPLPPKANARPRRKWKAVSTFDTLALAADRALALQLGSWAAELAVPDQVELDEDAPRPLGRHVSIIGSSPAELLGYVRRVHALGGVQSS